MSSVIINIRPHAVLFPCPLLGHIRPMMQLAQCLARRDFIVTFVNTEHNHSLILKAQKSSGVAEHGDLDIRLVALPDRMAPDENRAAADLPKFTDGINSTLKPSLEKLILDLRQEGEPVTCIISDIIFVDVKEIAEKLGIPRASFWSSSIAIGRIFYDYKVFETNGDIAPDGVPLDMTKMVASLPGVPKLRSSELPWVLGNDKDNSAFLYETMVKPFVGIAGSSSWILCNSCMELEREVLEGFPHDVNIAPIGPLFAYKFNDQEDNRTSVGLWEEDNDCLLWLDGRRQASVVYVSFGSSGSFSQAQLQEMAMGMEASEQDFLWVVRADLMVDGMPALLPEGFLERTKERGRVVSWAPQLQVLAHPAVGCFVTHCGWNSTMEGVYHGVPAIAWPYFTDQFTNRAYLVEEWKVGRAMEMEMGGVVEGGGLVTRDVVEAAVRGVMERQEGQEMRARAEELSICIRASVQDGGSSKTKLDDFILEMHRLASTLCFRP